MTAAVGLWIDWDEALTWGNAHANCTALLISATYTRGSAPEITGAAQAGSATFVLQNPAGLFDPDNAAGPLYGKLHDGVPVWFGMNEDGTITTPGTVRGRFAGRIVEVAPLPVAGAGDSTPTAEIICEDALGWYGRTPVALSDDCSPPVPCPNATPAGYYPPIGVAGGLATGCASPSGSCASSGATGYIEYWAEDGGAPTAVADPYHCGSWHFPSYQQVDGSVPGGIVDGAATDVANHARMFIVGPGTITVYTRAMSGTSNRFFDAYLQHIVGVSTVTEQSQLGLTPGTDVVFVVPDDPTICDRWVDLHFRSTVVSAGYIGFGGFTWVPL